MRSIFISYRRDDAEGQAGRLFDELSAYFGSDAVFMDVDAIEPGRDFRRVIDEQVAQCGVLLAVIGKGWLGARDESGRRRLDDPSDFVRLETASALKRDIPVVPVLVHSAKMPRADELPDDLKELAFRNGVEISHARWDSDVGVLVKALQRHVPVKPAQPAAASAGDAGASPARRSKAMLIGVAGALSVAVAAFVVWQQQRPVQQKEVVPVAAAPAVVKPSAVEPLAPRNWDGAWQLEWQYDGKWYGAAMKTNATAQRVRGEYKGEHGSGTIDAGFEKANFAHIAGEYINTSGSGVNCANGRQGGTFEFTLAADANSMSGWWTVCGMGDRRLWRATRQ